MEKYVVSKDLAEKLRDAGYPQDTQFTWYLDGDDSPALNWTNQSRIVGGVYHTDKVTAPLSDEILEQLPGCIQSTLNGHAVSYHFHIGYAISGMIVVSYQPVKEDILYRSYAPTLANALADMWLWCKANNHLNPRKEV